MVFTASIFAQPQGVNYQAVVRDATGHPIADQSVELRIDLRRSSPSGELVWQEEQAVNTNSFGMVTLVLFAENANQTGGSAENASSIPWGDDTWYIDVFIDTGQGFTKVGSSVLNSVPFALYAGDGPDADDQNEIQDLVFSSGRISLTGDPDHTVIDLPAEIGSVSAWKSEGDTVSYLGHVGVGTDRPMQSMLAVQGNDSLSEEPLFEVKRKDGLPIFAVYNDGVWVYVDADEQKGIKGGFAVGGYTSNKKGSVEEYLRVTPDSVRIYIRQDENEGKGIKGGFAVGGYTSTYKEPSSEFLRVSADSVRVYIDDRPESKGLKGGFAVGGYHTNYKAGDNEYFNISGNPEAELVTPSEPRMLWYPRRNALLTGQVIIDNTDSVGVNSMASGYETRAIGDFSQAFGYQSRASGDYSLALGKKARTWQMNSVAIGDSAQTKGESSYAFGNRAEAIGNQSFAFGSWTRDQVFSSINATIAEGDNSMALGIGTNAKGNVSFSIGSAGYYSGDQYPMPIYTLNSAEADRSMALGFGNKTYGVYAIALGRANKAYGSTSLAMGYRSETHGDYSNASGFAARTTSNYSHSLGYHTVANEDYSMVVGSCNDTTMSGVKFAVGDGYRIVGSNFVRRNAFTVFNGGNAYLRGSLGLGTSSPSQRLHVNGNILTASGYGVYLGSTNIGMYENSTDLHITADDDLMLKPDDDIYISRDGYSSWAIFDNSAARLGLGTTTPSSTLDVNGDVSIDGDISFGSGGNRYLSLPDRTMSLVIGGRWNVLNSAPYNIYFVTNGASNMGTIKMTISGSSGNVGIGTTSPGSYKLYVNGTTYSSGGYLGSDLRYKSGIRPIAGALNMISMLGGKRFVWKQDEYPDKNFENGEHFGLIAQEVNEVLPELVKSDSEGYLAVSYTELIPVMIEAIKEQEVQITALSETIAMQQKELDALKQTLNTILAEK
jgi:hypothetical protein